MIKKLHIKLIKPSGEKVRFVKLIKDCSGLGLKESKELFQNLHTNPEKVVEMPIRDWETKDWSTGITTPAITDYAQKFITEMKSIDGHFIINGGLEWQRNIKVMKLGIGENDDYIDVISEYLLARYQNSEEIMREILRKLKKEDLIEVISKIEL